MSESLAGDAIAREYTRLRDLVRDLVDGAHEHLDAVGADDTASLTLLGRIDSLANQRDLLRSEVERMRPVYEAARHRYSSDVRMAYRGDLVRLRADERLALAAAEAESTDRRIDDTDRCAVCGWSLSERIEDGCVRGNCSYRPRPEKFYAPERAAKEAGNA